MRSNKLAFLSAMLLFMIAFTGCSGSRSDKSIFYDTGESVEYIELIWEELSDHEFTGLSFPTLQSFMERGRGVVTFDVVAQSFVESDKNYYWYPHFDATVVIAADRDRTDRTIRGWEDLLESELEIGMTDTFLEAGLMLSAMTVTPSGENGSIEIIVSDLAKKFEQGQLSFNKKDVPLQVLFDYQAAEQIAAGRNLEIIIPIEGTYTYQKGVLSKQPLSFSSDLPKKLKGAELYFRAPNLETASYPSSKAYERAIRPEHADRVNAIVADTREYINRVIVKSHLYTTANAYENTFSAMLLMCVIVLWTGSVLMRTMQKDTSAAMLGIGVSLLCWTLIRFMKWQVATYTLANRYIWYSYYFFLLAMGSCFLWLVKTVNNPKEEIEFPERIRNVAIVQAAALLLVYTNDLHQWVFVFDKESSFWIKEYSYGFGYWLVMAAMTLPLLIGVGMLCFKIWKSPKKIRILLPIFIILLMLIHMYLYVNRVPFVFNGDITVMTCIFLILFGETAMRTNLIPLNTKYVALFRNSTLGMAIISSSGEVAHTTTSAVELPKSLIGEIISLRKSATLKTSESRILYIDPISGGYALWEEDIREIVALREKVADSIERLTRSNDILERRSEIQARREAVRARTLLNKSLHEEIDDQLMNMQELALKLHELEASDAVDQQDRQSTLAQINLTGIYIKRRCNFLFYAEQEAISSDAFVTYVSEILEAARFSGIRTASIMGIREDLTTEVGILIYDFCFAMLAFAAQKNIEEIMFHLYREDEEIHALFVAEAGMRSFTASEKLRRQMDAARAELSHKHLGAAESVQLRIPRAKR